MNTYQQNYLVKSFFFTIITILCYFNTFAQTVSQNESINVTSIQVIQFGAFCSTGNGGGSITIAYDGSRTCTGDIVLLSMNPQPAPAIFETKLCPGKYVTILYDAITTIRTNNATVLKMDVGPTDLGSNGEKFSTTQNCNSNTTIRSGGTLHIPPNCKAGNYSGNFNITLKLD